MGECMTIFVRKSDVARLDEYFFAELLAFISRWDGTRWHWLENTFHYMFSKMDKAKFTELRNKMVGKCVLECEIERLLGDDEEWDYGELIDEITDKIYKIELFRRLAEIYDTMNVDLVIVSDYTKLPEKYRGNPEYVSGETLLMIAKNAIQEKMKIDGAMEQNET